MRDRLRANSVRRWHIVNTARSQSVAEHSYNVAVICMAILNQLNMGDYWGDKCCRLAIEHDQDEVVTGDIPSNSKDGDWKNKFNGPISPAMIVKMADLIDAYTWMSTNATDQHGIYVWEWLQDKVDIMILSLPHRYGVAVQSVITEITKGKMTI